MEEMDTMEKVAAIAIIGYAVVGVASVTYHAVNFVTSKIHAARKRREVAEQEERVIDAMIYEAESLKASSSK